VLLADASDGHPKMNRRFFLLATGAALSGRAFEDNGERASQHRLPVTDSHDERVKGYIEEVPMADYHWASSQAYDRFHDIKYGIRIHWGIYSIAGLKSTAGFMGSPGNIRKMQDGRARLRERRMPRRSSCCCKGKRTRLTQ
jgi:hypothetical protein